MVQGIGPEDLARQSACSDWTIAQVLVEWKAIAALRADPELADELARPIPEPDGLRVPAACALEARSGAGSK